MFRRAAVPSSLSKTLTQSRTYTDFHHHKYGIYKPHAVPIIIFMAGFWMWSMTLGSVWMSRPIHKLDSMEFARRHFPKGYKWADEYDATPLKSIYVNLPDSVE